MFTRVQVRALVAGRWPALLGGAVVVGYAILVVGFGLDFRPLHHDEVVTLHVAGQPSAGDVLHVAIWDRHGPPLHYLIVHASLDWRHDILGLRLPSALFGILAVGLAYGCGRELMGRAGGATMAVVTAVTPITIHLAQFARGYTAMIACAYGSLWLMLVLLRTGRLRWAVPYALAALLLVASHPFGLFALASELVLLAGLGGYEIATRRRHDRRAIAALAAGLVLGAAAFLWLRHLYAPLQSKYGVGSGGAVVDLTSRSFWSDLASHVTGSSVAGVLVPRGSGRRARDRLARIPRPPGGDRRHGVARAAAAPAPDPHGVIRGLCARAPPVVPAARVLDRALRVRARARPPARAAPYRRGRGARHAAHAAPRVGPKRPLELQRRSPRREPRPRGRVRPARRPPDVGGRRRPPRGSAPARRVRRAGRARRHAARGVERRSTPPAGAG